MNMLLTGTFRLNTFSARHPPAMPSPLAEIDGQGNIAKHLWFIGINSYYFFCVIEVTPTSHFNIEDDSEEVGGLLETVRREMRLRNSL
jgi:hypothetical protein